MSGVNKPAGNDSPTGFDPRHVRAFLEKISEDRDEEVNDIRRRVEAETQKIRKDGYRAARRLASQVATDTREHQRREHDRFLYKARSELTRERWSILGDLHRRALDAVRDRFEAAWRDESRQWAWCRHWVDAGADLAAGAPLEVRLGDGTSDTVAERTGKLLDSYPGEWTVRVDTAEPAGVVISWPDHLLDGTLPSHIAVATEEVMERVAALLDPGGEMDQADEPG